ncbi:MAG: hypothetical protein WCS94_15335, partial [Verrucomicrobiota bacterium]
EDVSGPGNPTNLSVTYSASVGFTFFSDFHPRFACSMRGQINGFAHGKSMLTIAAAMRFPTWYRPYFPDPGAAINYLCAIYGSQNPCSHCQYRESLFLSNESDLLCGKRVSVRRYNVKIF